jgi:hypothetical protein
MDIEGSKVDEIEMALDAESRAHAAVLVVGDAWKTLQELRHEPTEEELALHAHLVDEWKKAARVVTVLLEKPLR